MACAEHRYSQTNSLIQGHNNTSTVALLPVNKNHDRYFMVTKQVPFSFLLAAPLLMSLLGQSVGMGVSMSWMPFW